jgi:hypothetical protein
VDLAGRAPEAAVARGQAAIDRFPGVLLRLGAGRIAAGAADDPAMVGPEYVSLRRGAGGAGRAGETGGVGGAAGAGVVTTWSPVRP